MGFIKVLVVLQISMLLMSLTNGYPLPPVPPPVMAPAMAPVAVPVPSPTIPKLPIRKPVAVQGVVFCKSCKYIKEDTLQDAKPLVGAVVKMVCYNTKRPKFPVVMTATTDKNGYFFIPPTKKVTTYGAQTRCRVFLAAAPKGSKCKFPTNLHGGIRGAYLKPTKPATPVDFALYTVGPFAFNPIPSACKY